MQKGYKITRTKKDFPANLFLELQLTRQAICYTVKYEKHDSIIDKSKICIKLVLIITNGVLQNLPVAKAIFYKWMSNFNLPI